MNKKLKRIIIPLLMAMTMALGSSTIDKGRAAGTTPQEFDQIQNSMKNSSYDELMNGSTPLSGSIITTKTTPTGEVYKVVDNPASLPTDDNVHYLKYGNTTIFYKYMGIYATGTNEVEHCWFLTRFVGKTLTGYTAFGYDEVNQALHDQLANRPKPPITSNKNYTLKRLYGLTRIDTARAIADEFSSGTLQNVVIASGLNYPDAMVSAPLAKKLNAPILLVGVSPVESVTTVDYVQKHLDKNGTIYILGGEGAVNNSFVETFKLLGYKNIKRISGLDRYATCNAINKELGLNTSKAKNNVFVVSGNGFADGLSVSSLAASLGAPIFLTDKDSIPEETKDLITNIDPGNLFIIGGEGVISRAVEDSLKSVIPNTYLRILRYGGADRYETSLQVSRLANGYFKDSDTICLANGENFPDALSGSALASKYNAPVILLNNDVNSDSFRNAKQFIDSKKYTKGIIFGGTGVVSDNIEKYLAY